MSDGLTEEMLKLIEVVRTNMEATCALFNATNILIASLQERVLKLEQQQEPTT